MNLYLKTFVIYKMLSFERFRYITKFRVNFSWSLCFLLSFVCGLAESFSYPPYGYLWLDFLCLPFLYGLYARSIGWSFSDRFVYCFVLGLSYGFGKFLHGVYWIHEAFIVEGDIFIVLGYFAVPFLAFALSLVIGFSLGISGLLGSLLGFSFFFDWLNFVFLLSFAEWFKGNFLIGFPWHMPVNALVANDNLLQFLSITGAFAGNFVIYAVTSSQYYLLDYLRFRHLNRIILPFFSIILCFFIYFYGLNRLSSSEEDFSSLPSLNIRLVQANIDQKEKWQKGNLAKFWEKTRKLSVSKSKVFPKGLEEIDFLIWAESQLPVLYDVSRPYFAGVRDILSPRSILVAGQLSLEKFDTGDKMSSRRYNSIVFVNREDGLLGRYDKVLLVPFSELILFKDILRFLGLGFVVDWSGGGFTAGSSSEIRYFPQKNTFLIPTICYETIFPNYIHASDKQKSGKSAIFLLSLSNDAWFGNGVGPRQLFEISRLRAVENGVTLLRVANTGISGIINPYGKVTHETNLQTEAIIDAKIQTKNIPTLATLYGNVFIVSLLVLFLILNMVSFFIVYIYKKL